MATTAPHAVSRLAPEEIQIPDNVRTLDAEHVKALAGSIQLQGILVPLVVRTREDGFELVAGFHRLAAARSLGLAEVPVVVRDADTQDADRAVENITRKQLNPYEEAKAVRAMLSRGFSEDGTAQALGWPKARVTARMKILELPERAQQLIGGGVIHLAAVDQLRAIGAVAPGLLDAVVAYLDDGNAWAAERLAREPGWVLDAAMTHSSDKGVFAAYLHTANPHEITELRLGKKTDTAYADAEKLHKQLDRYSYGPPTVRFTDEDVDRARAAGVLIEFYRSRPIIVDRGLYRELIKDAVRRTLADLQTLVTEAAKAKKQTRSAALPADPVTVAKRDRDTRLRDLADQAHNANTDLGHALMHELATVDPGDLNVARFLSTPCSAQTTTAPPTRRPVSASHASPPAESGLSSRSYAPTSPRPARTEAAAACGSTTAITATRRPQSPGCGSSSTAPRPPASSTAAPWSSSPPSSTPPGSSSPQASAPRRRAGARTRTTPLRR